MAKNQNVGLFDRNGKPSGNGRESEGLQDAFACTNPGSEEGISAEYLDDAAGEPSKKGKLSTTIVTFIKVKKSKALETKKNNYQDISI